MIAQFSILKKVKTLRHDKALRALETARATLQEAETRAEALCRKVGDSAETLPTRERALFTPILGAKITAAQVDEVKERVLGLIEDHQRLSDRRDRAQEHVKRCHDRLSAAREERHKRAAESEKIETLLSEMQQAAEDDSTAREEAEIEDVFARPRGIMELY